MSIGRFEMTVPFKDTNTPPALPPKTPKLLDQVRAKIRLKHYSIRTEQAYVDWIRQFILFHNKRHPYRHGCARS